MGLVTILLSSSLLLPLSESVIIRPRFTIVQHRLPSLKFRGGAAPAFLLLSSATPAAAAGTASLVNCVAGANGFFANVRVPAALLAGAALGQLWAAPVVSEQRPQWLRPLFSMLVAMTVACEMLVVLISTAAVTQLMNVGAFNPLATDTMHFLIREMELHFVSCRLNFFVGLLCFVGSLGVRGWATVEGRLGSGLALFFAATALHFVAYFNTTIVHYSLGVVGLACRWLTLVLPALASSAVGALSLVAYAGAIGYCAAALGDTATAQNKAKTE
jgi:hypothetical protein